MTFVPESLMLPSDCHWMPNSAAFSAETSAISDSITTWARRTSSLSMIWRMFRYRGSGAVMISEFVAGSAWIIPESGPVPPAPVVGCWPGAAAPSAGCWVVRPAPEVIPVEGDSPLPVVCGTNDGSELMMARNSGAIFAASALRR